MNTKKLITGIALFAAMALPFSMAQAKLKPQVCLYIADTEIVSGTLTADGITRLISEFKSHKKYKKLVISFKNITTELSSEDYANIFEQLKTSVLTELTAKNRSRLIKIVIEGGKLNSSAICTIAEISNMYLPDKGNDLKKWLVLRFGKFEPVNLEEWISMYGILYAPYGLLVLKDMMFPPIAEAYWEPMQNASDDLDSAFSRLDAILVGAGGSLEKLVVGFGPITQHYFDNGTDLLNHSWGELGARLRNVLSGKVRKLIFQDLMNFYPAKNAQTFGPAFCNATGIKHLVLKDCGGWMFWSCHLTAFLAIDKFTIKGTLHVPSHISTYQSVITVYVSENCKYKTLKVKNAKKVYIDVIRNNDQLKKISVHNCSHIPNDNAPHDYSFHLPELKNLSALKSITLRDISQVVTEVTYFLWEFNNTNLEAFVMDNCNMKYPDIEVDILLAELNRLNLTEIPTGVVESYTNPVRIIRQIP